MCVDVCVKWTVAMWCNVLAKLAGSRNNNNETAAHPFPLTLTAPHAPHSCLCAASGIRKFCQNDTFNSL